MPVYRGTIRKRRTTDPFEKWSNVYHVEAANVLDGYDILTTIANLEKLIYQDNVTIWQLAIADPLVRGSGGSKNVAIVGTAGTADPDTQLPLFNAVLVKLLPSGGRMSPKYLRLPLREADVIGNKLVAGTITSIDTNYSSAVWSVPGHVDESGQPFIGYATNENVQMRQLGWHRRVRPGFKRGWVAR